MDSKTFILFLLTWFGACLSAYKNCLYSTGEGAAPQITVFHLNLTLYKLC